MQIYAIIPSRYGSTRFDGKPLVPIAGKPMIQRVYERAQAATDVSDVFVATDDQRILNAVKEFGGQAVMTSVENRSGTDRVAEAAKLLGLELTDIIINIQGDQPCLNPKCLDELVAPFFKGPDIEMSTLAFKIVREEEKTNPKDVKVTFDVNDQALYFSRSLIPYARDPDISFDVYKHLGVYGYTMKFLEIFRKLPSGNLEIIERLEQLRAIEYGHRIQVVITEYDSPEVDIPEDIQRIEALLAGNQC
ncbi:3-deoxy-manno-octulosonate cytidylyltransferase [Thermodesulfobacteriota bacterium]